MPFHQFGEIHYFTFGLFEDAEVAHGTFTRRGGVSPHPWESLNVGGTVGDNADRVQENRQLLFAALDRKYESLFDVWQVHSAEVVCTDAPRPPQVPHLPADAILTDTEGVTLFMRFADCVPIFLFDPIRRAVGLVHAGWKGTVDKVVQIAVQAMGQRYRTRPQDVLAGIGPSIGAHHYPVGADVAEQVQRSFGMDAAALLPTSGDGSEMQFDLWAANCLLLEDVGVRHIEVSGICTACNVDDWFSHRAENGRTGRFGALIGL